MTDPDDRDALWGSVAGLVNILTGLLAVLSLPFALTAPMFVGMAGAYGGPSLRLEIFGLLTMAFPIVTLGAILVSQSCIRSGGNREGFVVAMLPVALAVLWLCLVEW